MNLEPRRDDSLILLRAVEGVLLVLLAALISFTLFLLSTPFWYDR